MSIAPSKLPQSGTGDQALRPRWLCVKRVNISESEQQAQTGHASLSLTHPACSRLPHLQGASHKPRGPCTFLHSLPYPSSLTSYSSQKPIASTPVFSISNSLCHSLSGHPGLHCQRLCLNSDLSEPLPGLRTASFSPLVLVPNPTRPPALVVYFF